MDSAVLMDTKPKILLLSTAYLPHIGGSELAAHHIAQRATDFDFDVLTLRLSADDPLIETIGRVRVYRVPFPTKLVAPFLLASAAVRLMRTERYTAVHAYQASYAGLAGVFVRLLKPDVPFIVTLQEGKDLDRQSVPIRLIRELIIRRADRLTAISRHLADYIRRYTRTPVELIPNGADIASLRVPDVAREATLVVTVSRLVEKNNVAGLIRAMVHVRERVPDAKLTVIGSGPLRSALSDLAADLQLSGIVDFVGAVHHDELPVWLARATVFARPSLSEGLGSAFLEAMAAGAAVVASPVGGIPDIVHHGSTGLLCDPHDPVSIADAIVQLMVDRPLHDRIVAEAAAMVTAKYDWAAIAQQMSRLYRSLQ